MDPSVGDTTAKPECKHLKFNLHLIISLLMQLCSIHKILMLCPFMIIVIGYYSLFVCMCMYKMINIL